MKKKVLNVIEIILIIIIAFICFVSIYNIQDSTNKFLGTINNFLNDKTNFVISILIPFTFLVILELIKLNRQIKRKELENKMELQLEELKSVGDNSKVGKTLEKNIETHLKEIEKAKSNFEKIDKLEKTIKIPFKEIQEQIEKLDNKETKELEDNIEENTMVLFTKDDIKEVIKKELESTKTVDKTKKTNKK